MKDKKKIIIIISVIAVVIILAVVLFVMIKGNDKSKTNLENQAGNSNASNNDISKNEKGDKSSSGVKVTAKEIKDNASTYYGSKVTNYTANGISDWKIFLSDGDSVYLISSDYLAEDKVPATKGGNTFYKGAYEKGISLRPVAKDSNYSAGTNSISNQNLAVNWIETYVESCNSSEDNMKAVAYLLDTDVWNVYKTDKADYAIGGPTVELLMASYSKKHNVDYQAKATSETGYQISEDGGTKWTNLCNGMLSRIETLYVLPVGSTSGANAMWLASPSAYSSYNVMDVGYNGVVGCDYSNNASVGFRPVVSLKSGISVTKNDDGSVTLK